MFPIIFNLLQIPNIVKKYSKKRVNIRFIFFYMCHTFKIMMEEEAHSRIEFHLSKRNGK